MAVDAADRMARMRERRKAEAEAKRKEVAGKVVAETSRESVCDWVERHCKPSSKEPWQAPAYVRDLLRVFECADGLRSVFLRKGCRIGWTVVTTAFMARSLCLGRDVAAFQPRVIDASTYRRDTVRPAFERVEPLQELEAVAKVGESGLASKVLANGGSFLLQGGSGGEIWRRWTADYAVVDEYDAFPLLVGGGDREGTVAVLARRGLQSRKGKLLAAGTPSNALGASRIASEAERADVQCVFAFPCPHCGELDHLVWERLRWPTEQPDEVQHLCASCGTLSSQAVVQDAVERAGRWRECHKPDADDRWPALLGNGRWIGDGGLLMDAKGQSTQWPQSLGLHLWSAYSPWMDWRELSRLWIQCHDDPAQRRGFLEQYLARPDAGQVESASQAKLRGKRKPIAAFAPGTSVIVGLDVQQGWLSALVCGFTAPERVQILERVEFHDGGIDDVGRGVWRELADWLLSTQWQVKGETPRYADWLAVDVGYQQSLVLDAMQWLAEVVAGLQIRACKGEDGWGKPDMTPRQTKDGRRFWGVGTYPLKASVLSRLVGPDTELSDRLPDAVCAELAGEEVRTVTRRGRLRRQWVQTRESVEAWDCLVYAVGCWRSVVGRTTET